MYTFVNTNVFYLFILLITIPPISKNKMAKVAGFKRTLFQLCS